MSRYLEILSVQSPFVIGTDTNDRTLYSVNFNMTVAAPTVKFEEEIGRLLFDNSLGGVFNTDTFIGSPSTLPSTPGPLINLIDTGGTSPLETHDGSKYERRSMQIVIRATNRAAARTRAMAIWRLLDGQRDITITAA